MELTTTPPPSERPHRGTAHRAGPGGADPLQARAACPAARSSGGHRPGAGRHGRRLILADEPTAALDKDSGRKVVDMLQELAKERTTTILMVTHDNRILDVADRIVNMVDGHVISDVSVLEASNIIEFLKKSPLFAPLSANTLADVADRMDLEHQAAGGIVIRQGDPGDKLYVIRSGEAGGSDRAGRRAARGDTEGGRLFWRGGAGQRRAAQRHGAGSE